MNDTDQRAASDIENRKFSLTEEVFRSYFETQNEVWRGEVENMRESMADASNLLDFLIEAVRDSDPPLLSEYCLWLSDLFNSRGLPSSVLPSLLEYSQKILLNRLSEGTGRIACKYIADALEKLNYDAIPQGSFVESESPLADLAKEYLRAVLRGDRGSALRLVLDNAENGTDIQDIYIEVLQRAQYEVGRLWHGNKVTVAQEHYCSATTQMAMSQLYPMIFRTERIGKNFVGASVGGELHEIGIRMVADFFEMDGWDTYYLGANTPVSGIVGTALAREPEMIGISATMPFHVQMVKKIISELRDSKIGASVKVLVGGYAMKRRPNLWRQVGADGYAEDGRQAAMLAREMVGKELSA